MSILNANGEAALNSVAALRDLLRSSAFVDAIQQIK